METPPDVSFQHMDPSDDVQALVYDRIAKLERFCDHITTCSVAVAREQSEADTGDRYRARVHLHVPPHHEIIAEHHPAQVKQSIGARGAIADAFDTAERRLRKINDRQNNKRRRP